MKPVLVLQHQSDDGPSYLADWLGRHRIPMVCRNVEAGEAAPASIEGFAGVAILGGAMSVNEDLPFLRHEEALIHEAIARNVPVIGHCLGGQLMARALGGRVEPAAVPEIGWHGIEVQEGPDAGKWFGDLRTAIVFQWHYDRFDLPPDAARLASSPHCPNQAFAIGPHLAMQFHVEVDVAKIAAWVRTADDAYRQARASFGRSVQDRDEMLEGIERHLQTHQALAERIYQRWWSGCCM